MDEDRSLRAHLTGLLRAGYAHTPFQTVIADWKPALRGVRPSGASHTAWQLLEHVRLAQWDILEFSRDPGHVSPKFPDGYWPQGEAPPDEAAWQGSIDGFNRDLDAMIGLIGDTSNDLHAPFPHGDGQTLLREALVLASHNSYHVGQLMMLRKQLGA